MDDARSPSPAGPPLDAPDPVPGGWVAAVCVLIVRDGRVLALRRSGRRAAGPGLWECVSGRLEPFEELPDAAAREALEETGLRVTPDPRPLDAYPAERLGRPMVVVCYRADAPEGADADLRLSDEHDAHAWLDADGFAERSTLGRLARVVRRALAREGA